MRPLPSLLALLLMPVAFPLSGSAGEKAGNVVRHRGSAEIQREERSLQARTGAVLQKQDSVRTRARTRIKMLFVDDSVLTLGPNSILVVQQHLAGRPGEPVRSIYELVDGKLRAVAGGPGFTVKTPTAFAAARGTVFTLWYDRETDSTGIEVHEGTVEIRNIREEIAGSRIISAGERSVIPRDHQPALPSPVPPGEAGAADDVGGVDLPEPTRYDAVSGDAPLRVSLRESFAGLTAVVPPIGQEPARAAGDTSTTATVNVVFP